MSSSFRNSFCSCISQKWVFAILASIGLCIQYLFSVIMSITIIEMVVATDSLTGKDTGSCQIYENATSMNRTLSAYYVEQNTSIETSIKHYPWDEYTQGIILSSFFWSNTITHFFTGPMAERFGGKYLLGIGTLGQAVISFLTPVLVDWGGSTALIITRVLTGLVTGGMYPISSTMISKWTLPKQRTTIGNTIYAGSVLGLFFGNIIPPLILKHSDMGWPAVFYFLGIVALIWFPFWQFFVYDNPEEHPFISEKELNDLKRLKVGNASSKLPAAPWKHILSCKEFWAFTINLIGSNWAFFAMLSGLPKYMGNVVKFSLESNGYFSAIPFLIMWLFTVLSAWLSKKMLKNQLMSLTNTRKLWSTVSTTGPAIFLLLASYAECDKIMVVIWFMIGITLIGSVYPSLMMNPLDLSPNYAGSIMSAGSGVASSVGFLAPYLVGVMAPNSTLSEWRMVFWMVFLFAVVSNAVYLLWFKAEVQSWNYLSFQTFNIDSIKVTQDVDNQVVVDLDVMT